MLNSCSFIGNVGKDPEIRSMQNGDKVANLSIACTEKWKSNGEAKERTTWVPVVVWGALAGIVDQYVRKGSKLYVSGKFSVRKWQDAQGADRYSTEIVLQGFDAKLVMLDGPSGGSDRGGGFDGGTQSRGNGGPSQRRAAPAFDDDDGDSIPF